MPPKSCRISFNRCNDCKKWVFTVRFPKQDINLCVDCLEKYPDLKAIAEKELD